MERRMTARFSLIAAAVLVVGTSVSAEPPKELAQSPAKRADAAPVLLAAADQVRPSAPATDQPAPVAAKHRAARVTTCRCGDQVAEQPDQ